MAGRKAKVKLNCAAYLRPKHVFMGYMYIEYGAHPDPGPREETPRRPLFQWVVTFILTSCSDNRGHYPIYRGFLNDMSHSSSLSTTGMDSFPALRASRMRFMGLMLSGMLFHATV